MRQYKTEELKTAWCSLWNTDADKMWVAVNNELARRLSREEYALFVERKGA